MRATHVAVALFAVGTVFDGALVVLPRVAPDVPAFEVGMWHLLGWTLGMWVYTLAYRPAGGPRWGRDWETVIHTATGRGFWLYAVGRLSIVLLLASAAISGPTVAAVVYGLWPVGWSMVLRRSTRVAAGEDRYKHVGARTAATSLAACAGAMLTVLAQPLTLRSDSALIAAGMGLALAALAVDGFNGLNLALGIGAARRSGLGDSAGVEVWFTVAVAVLIGVVGCSAVAVALATASGVAASAPDAAVCVLFGAVLAAATSVLGRWALSLSDNSMLTVIGCATPALSVAYLAALDMLEDIDIARLVAGTTVVVVAGGMAIFSSRDTKQRYS